MADKRYDITRKLAVPGLANPRYQGLNRREAEQGGRIIGGDWGDLEFYGYDLDYDRDETVLSGPTLISQRKFAKNEAYEVARDILMEAYASIGLEAVEHS